jgi:formyltetrahydrofolate deformylase
MNNSSPRFILNLTCADVSGIVAAVSTYLTAQGAFILESQQYGDPATNYFFMRIVGVSRECSLSDLTEKFTPLAQRFAMTWQLTDPAKKPRILIGVSKFGHCLNDLLHRWSSAALPVDIVGVFSNHENMRKVTEWHGLPYHYLPVTKDTRAAQEQHILDLVDQSATDLVVLARYMQILSENMCQRLSWRCINIHHSFLPSFKGAKPYHQAHHHGVKLIGATAHFVTSNLDEGPIIEQAAERVHHGMTPEDLVAIGSDIEAQVLARAVRWWAERRVLPNGSKTVVFG